MIGLLKNALVVLKCPIVKKRFSDNKGELPMDLIVVYDKLVCDTGTETIFHTLGGESCRSFGLT